MLPSTLGFPSFRRDSLCQGRQHCGNPPLQVLLKGLSQRRLGHSADDSVHLGAILEDHHSWDAADAVLCCYSRALVCVELELQQEVTLVSTLI